MGLNIWQEQQSGVVSTGDMSAPVIFRIPPAGGSETKQLYLRHENLSGTDPDASYSVSVGGADIHAPHDTHTWVEVADDVAGAPGTWALAGDAKALGDVLGGEIKPFWVRITTPSDAEYGVRNDLKLRMNASGDHAYVRALVEDGTFTDCTVDVTTGGIRWQGAEGKTGFWRSAWVDVTGASSLNGVDFTHHTGGSTFKFRCRSSSDGTEATATAWRTSFEDVEVLKYAQIEIAVDRQGPLNETGLNRYYQGGLNATGTNTYVSTPNDNTTWEWKGYWYAPTSGDYTFRDGSSWKTGEFWIDDVQIYPDGGQKTVYLTAGIYKIYYNWWKGGGSTLEHRGYVTYPGGTEQVLPASAYGNENSYSVVVDILTDIRVRYTGIYDLDHDIQVFDGPDVPRHIDPPNGYKTASFAPDLTVHTHNCDSIEFQMDTKNTFDSADLSQWTVLTSPSSECVSKSPTTDRPPGIWYWRARGLKDGKTSAWSTYSWLEILPLVTAGEVIYLTENVGINTHDNINDDRLMYLNVNIGIALHDPIVDNRLMYLNVNIDNGYGKIHYPIEDDTPVRKRVFPGDTEAF